MYVERKILTFKDSGNILERNPFSIAQEDMYQDLHCGGIPMALAFPGCWSLYCNQGCPFNNGLSWSLTAKPQLSL